MNILQTRQVLSYLWSTHPNSPKFTDNDKARTVASYFRVLHKYALDDVMEAVDQACKKTPSFIPTAYEIEALCVKSPNVERFLPREYRELSLKFIEFSGCYFQDLVVAHAELSLAETDDEKAEAQRRVNGIKGRIEIEEKMHALYKQAECEALAEYDRQQSQLAFNDLKALGYERLALEE